MAKISDDKLGLVKDLYYNKLLCMREIGEQVGVPIDAVIYFMRKHGVKCRDYSATNKLLFDKKSASFRKKEAKSDRLRELRAIGAMLYWAEGYKSDKGRGVDFANSDPEMISMFITFLRGLYELDEKKLRVLLYCYSNQNIKHLINFWSKLTKIPKNQFTKPYIRENFRDDGRKMPFGLIHIRYFDKKLLLDLKSEISFYKDKFGQVVP